MMTVYFLSQEARRNSNCFMDADLSVAEKSVRAKNFTKVAAINENDDLDRAFFLTNTIDNYWWDNENVIKGPDDGYRSSMVGDMIELSDGTFWMVDGCGFKEVN